MVRRILVADDHAIVRKGIVSVIRKAFDFVTIREVGTGDELLRQSVDGRWDVVIMDLSMPGLRDIPLLGAVRARFSGVPIVVISARREDLLGQAVLAAGASAYLPKEAAPELLIDAVRAAAAGRRFVTPRLKPAFSLDAKPVSGSAPHEKLSDRELEVLRMLAEGKRVTDISRQLGLSVKTVSTYRSRTLQKLELADTPSLVKYACEHGLVRPDAKLETTV